MAWTADSREVVFSSTRQNSYRLWRIPSLPANRRGVFNSPKPVEAAGDDAGWPSISQNGRLAYQHDTRNWDILRAEIAAGEPGSNNRLGPPTPLIASTRIETAPAWSPDGKKIAFVSNRSGYFEVWICDADGSNPVRLTAFDGPSFMIVMSLHWSSDNERLIFSALTGPNGNPEGYIISVKGGTPKRIDTTDHRSMAFPIFSVDEPRSTLFRAPRKGRWRFFRCPPREDHRYRSPEAAPLRPRNHLMENGSVTADFECTGCGVRRLPVARNGRF